LHPALDRRGNKRHARAEQADPCTRQTPWLPRGGGRQPHKTPRSGAARRPARRAGPCGRARAPLSTPKQEGISLYTGRLRRGHPPAPQMRHRMPASCPTAGHEIRNEASVAVLPCLLPSGPVRMRPSRATSPPTPHQPEQTRLLYASAAAGRSASRAWAAELRWNGPENRGAATQQIMSKRPRLLSAPALGPTLTPNVIMPERQYAVKGEPWEGPGAYPGGAGALRKVGGQRNSLANMKLEARMHPSSRSGCLWLRHGLDRRNREGVRFPGRQEGNHEGAQAEWQAEPGSLQGGRCI
jgi:hypothetical protein